MDESQALERVAERLMPERRVRALAEVDGFGTPPTLLVFERGLTVPRQETAEGVQRQHFAFELLEGAEPLAALHQVSGELPGLIAQGRIIYDPSANLGKMQRVLRSPSPETLAERRFTLLTEAETRLNTAERPLTVGSGVAAQLLALMDARTIAAECLYPALLTYLPAWPSADIRLPHLWRAQAGMRYPLAVYHLDALYGFGGETEARRALLATRGLNLVDAEKHARAAVQAGYYDGAVQYLRHAAARRTRADVERWTYLGSARQDKLATLLGAGVSPLGPVAISLCRTLIEDVRVGR
ncbi:hypothetical protein [Deinococcus sp.]|uniref:hypothetical protein n=1 Tax=Deinococcus sp. TaxID=47478 RepID=UPI003B5A243E